jgi:hypothetical protein
MYKKTHAIANQKTALIQLAVCRASSVATPKKSRKIAKLVPSLIFLISTSLQSHSDRSATSGSTFVAREAGT